MNTAPIRTAVIDHDADGTPRSREHDDVYHPRGGALAQARHVFLDDGKLAERWRGRERFVVLETGFGLGNNFLATWAAWRDDPERCARLHFVSIEATPPDRRRLAAVARDPVLQPLADELVAQWPPHTWNLHRLAFADGGVELLLAFGDVSAWLPQLVASVDAFFLDGFAPARNPAMWGARLYKAMARLAAPNASVATWTAARAVREGLQAAGFDVALAPGANGKRDITRAVFAPRFEPRRPPGRVAIAAPRQQSSQRVPVVIVGAGLAGCALARALADGGRSSLLIDRRGGAAAEASGNAAGLFHGVVHGADGRHARFHRAAAFAAHAAVADARARHGVAGAEGLLRIEPGAPADGSSLQEVIDRLGLPGDYVRALSTRAASDLAGIALSAPAWHYPQGGWVDPQALARAWLADAAPHVVWRPDCTVGHLERLDDDRWAVLDDSGRLVVTASTVVLCNASGAVDGSGLGPWPVRRQRGQVSAFAVGDAAPTDVPRLPITGSGYALPAIDGRLWFGATAQWHDDDAGVRESDHVENLARWRRLVGARGVPDIDRLSGRTAWRWVSDDRLPIIGAVPAGRITAGDGGSDTPPAPRLDQPRLIARVPGLFVFAALGSRGIASASLGARMLAATIAGAPSVVEADLIDAVDPARFVSRRFRRDESARNRGVSPEAQPPEAGSPGDA